MTEEQKTQTPTNQEPETPSTALVPVATESQSESQKKGLNIKTLMFICEAVRRVFPSKQKLTLDQIKHFIRTEGFVPIPNSDEGVAFKVQGETYEIHYDGVRLCFVKTYSLPEEGLSMRVMSAACRKVTGEVYGVKAMLGKEENTYCLRFCAESICRSYSDFSSQFNYYMGAINHCVNFQKDAYCSLLEQMPSEREESKTPRRKIGFIQEANRPSEQSASDAGKESTKMSNNRRIGY